MNPKDPSIHELLRALSLEERGWVVLDDWDADLCAVGIAHRSQPRRLVYVSTWKKPLGRYYYGCEAPKGPEPTDYEVTDEADDVDLAALVRAMVGHLSPCPSS
jgi:hypothetical protein